MRVSRAGKVRGFGAFRGHGQVRLVAAGMAGERGRGAGSATGAGVWLSPQVCVRMHGGARCTDRLPPFSRPGGSTGQLPNRIAACTCGGRRSAWGTLRSRRLGPCGGRSSCHKTGARTPRVASSAPAPAPDSSAGGLGALAGWLGWRHRGRELMRSRGLCAKTNKPWSAACGGRRMLIMARPGNDTMLRTTTSAFAMAFLPRSRGRANARSHTWETSMV